MIFLDLGILAIVAAVTWWLTGYDKTAGGESKQHHHLTRALRVVAVVFLVLLMLFSGSVGYGGGPILMTAPLGIALVLRSCLSEIFAHGFLRMVDPMYDDREFDPNKTRRYQDTIAHLIHTGQREEAIKLCEELKKSGEVPLVTLENTLEFLGVKQERGPVGRPMVEASRLRTQRKFTEAVQLLQSLLVKNPADDAAAIMLMRVYAEDLRQPDLARQVLQALEKQPYVSAAHLDFARRSIDEWSRPQPSPLPEAATPQPQPQSIDDLLRFGSLGTAVERLEEQVRTQPGDFDLRLKLAEVYAVHCKNLVKAEKIIRQLDLVPGRTPQQAARLRAKLEEWHTGATIPRAVSIKPPA